MSKKPNFSSFGKTSTKEVVASKNLDESATDAQIEIRHVQARLIKKDAVRFKRAAEDNGFTQHDGLIEAMNLIMSQWGEPPLSSIGAAKKLDNDIII